MTSSSVFSKRWHSLLAFALIGLLLVGCVPLPVDPSWASVTLFGDQQFIMFAFHDRVTLIDPADGSAVELRDSTGNVRVDSQTGNPLVWDLRLQAQPATQFYSAPIVQDEFTLLFPTFSRRFYEIDSEAARINNPEGRLIEDPSTTNQIVADVLATDDSLYIPLSEGDVRAVNRSDWTTRWIFDTPFGVWSSPVISEDTVYFTSLDHFLYAVDALTGDERWRVDLGGAVPSQPLVANGFLYVGSFGNKLFKISPEGQIVAEFTTKDWVWGTPTLDVEQNILYTADSSGWVYALDISGDTFTEIWSRQVSTRGFRATPLIAGDELIVAGRERIVYWLSREDGQEQFRREVAGEVLANPILIEANEGSVPRSLVVVSTMVNQELLVAFTLDEAARLWVYSR